MNAMKKCTLLLRQALVVVVLTLLCANQTLSWGVEGHEVVASIAEQHLTPQALAKAQEILGPGVSLSAVANWADQVRRVRPKTAPLHFIDIPLQETAIDPARDCPDKACVTEAIKKYAGVLSDSTAGATDKNEALKFVVHFVGDLHQPLHCENNNDKGGNLKKVTFLGKKTNLHSSWDTAIIQDIDNDTEDYSDALNQNIQPADITKWEQGTVDDWALEAHAVAQAIAYGKLSKAKTPRIGQAYLGSAEPAVDLQLERAGIRLAHVLNQALQ